jgi:uncharacterized membrane protein
MNANLFLIPIALFICITLVVVGTVAIVQWYKARDKELQYHQDLRVREMEYQLKMKQLEIELEKARQKNT